jgi:anti-sigma factor RsiW
MACEAWGEKLDAYVDGELASSEANALNVHLRECAACAAEALQRVQMKRALAAAGKRYEPSAQFRARVAKSVSAKRRWKMRWQWLVVAVPAVMVLVVSILVNLSVQREKALGQRVYSELTDLHVAALASATPVDVLSTDRHTVKPWFEGKLPFTFNLPELQGSEFTLLGGRVTYLEQTPGAHLIYQLRKHRISVFIFPEQSRQWAQLPSGAVSALSFQQQSWTQNGLRYFVVGDVSADDIQALSKLLHNAG